MKIDAGLDTGDILLQREIEISDDDTTETLSVYAYKMLMRAGDFGYGSALSVATFACVTVLAAVLLAVLGPRQEVL